VKLYYALSGVFMLGSVVVLTSRGSWLGVGAGLFVMLLIIALYSKNKKIIIFGILGIILVSSLTLGFFKVYSAQNSRLTLSLSEENAKTRLYAWSMAREAIVSRPLVGVGLGNFQQFFEQNREKYLSNSVQNFDDAHNLFLQIGATAGAPVLLIFVVLLMYAILLAISYFKKNRDYLALATIGSIVVFSISASFTPVSIPCYLFLAVLLSLAFSFSERESLVEARQKKIFVAMYFVVGACLIIMGTGLIVAEHIFYKAVLAYAHRDFKKAEQLSTLAINFNPTNQVYYLYKAGSQVLIGDNPQAFIKTENKLIA
jgi:O-antigen ligase